MPLSYWGCCSARGRCARTVLGRRWIPCRRRRRRHGVFGWTNAGNEWPLLLCFGNVTCTSQLPMEDTGTKPPPPRLCPLGESPSGSPVRTTPHSRRPQRGVDASLAPRRTDRLDLVLRWFFVATAMAAAASLHCVACLCLVSCHNRKGG